MGQLSGRARAEAVIAKSSALFITEPSSALCLQMTFPGRHSHAKPSVGRGRPMTAGGQGRRTPASSGASAALAPALYLPRARPIDGEVRCSGATDHSEANGPHSESAGWRPTVRTMHEHGEQRFGAAAQAAGLRSGRRSGDGGCRADRGRGRVGSAGTPYKHRSRPGRSVSCRCSTGTAKGRRRGAVRALPTRHGAPWWVAARRLPRPPPQARSQRRPPPRPRR